MSDLELAEWFSHLPWGWRVAALIAGALGSVFPAAVLANKLWPDADKRLEDRRQRRLDDEALLRELRAELHKAEAESDAWQGKWLAAEAAKLELQREFNVKLEEALKQVIVRDTQLEVMRSRMRLPVERDVMPLTEEQGGAPNAPDAANEHEAGEHPA